MIFLRLERTADAQPENAASARTCEIAGGKLLQTARIPEDNEMYAEGKRFVRVYRLEL